MLSVAALSATRKEATWCSPGCSWVQILPLFHHMHLTLAKSFTSLCLRS